MTFHGEVCSLVFANQKKNILVGSFFFFSLPFWETITWAKFAFRKKNETKNKYFTIASIYVTWLHNTVMWTCKNLLVLWTKKSWARPSNNANGARIVLPFHSAVFSRQTVVLMGIASWPQDGCFTSSITSASPEQRKCVGKAEWGGTCLRKIKACSPAEFLLDFTGHPSPWERPGR